MRSSLLAILLAGCASYNGYNLHAGDATESQVRATMGAPSFTFLDP